MRYLGLIGQDAAGRRLPASTSSDGVAGDGFGRSVGTVYVDIPTNDGVFPPGTGLSDFFFGEIRGRIR